MKRYQLIGGVLLIFSLFSCNSWLDVEPSTDMDRGELFKNESGYADAMSGIYTAMCDNSVYGKNMTWYVLELMGGGAYTFGGVNANYQKFCFVPETPYTYFEQWQRATTDEMWSKGYNMIANINSLLSTIDKNKHVFASGDYEVFKGEALGLRAFLHFDLLRLFSDAYSSAAFAREKTYIPYVTGLEAKVYPLLTADQATDAMLTDLQEALSLLVADPMYKGTTPGAYLCSTVEGYETNRKEFGIASWHNRRLHFNYYAALATMARIYLWRGEKAKALQCAEAVIRDQPTRFPWVNPVLVANTANIKTNISKDRTFATEHIFALNVTQLDDKTDGFLWEGSSSFATSTTAMGINTDYCFDAATRNSDPRYVYLKTPYLSDYTISTKLWQDSDDGNNYFPWAKFRLPLIRISEMYYIAAECEPDFNKAKEYLEEVRKHRGLMPYPLTCTTREELQAEIEKEYRKEFVSEGQLFYYKKRMNQDIKNVSRTETFTLTPTVYRMPRPDSEDTYGNRN